MRFILVDTETSGLLDDPQAYVVELAAALFDSDVEGDDPIATYTTLVRPPILTDDGKAVIAKVSKIPIPEIEAARTPEELVTEVETFLSQAPVLAYNYAFDEPMVERTFGRLIWTPGTIGEMEDFRKQPACAMEAFTARFRPHTRTREDGAPTFIKLSAAARLLRIRAGEGDLHRALYDAVLAGRIALAIIRGAKAETVTVEPFEVHGLVRELPVFDVIVLDDGREEFVPSITIGDDWRSEMELGVERSERKEEPILDIIEL